MSRRESSPAVWMIAVVLAAGLAAVVYVVLMGRAADGKGTMTIEEEAAGSPAVKPAELPAEPAQPEEPLPQDVTRDPEPETVPSAAEPAVKAAAVPDGAAAVVVNGDFETRGAGEQLFAGWEFAPQGGKHALAAGDGHDGGHGAVFAGAGSGRGRLHNASAPVILTGGTQIEVTVWVKCEDVKGGAFAAFEGEPKDGWAAFEIGGGTYDWHPYVRRFNVPGPAGKTHKAQLWFYTYGTGHISLDDIAVHTVNSAEEDTSRAAAWAAGLAEARALAAQLAGGRDPGWAVGLADPVTRVFRDELFAGTVADTARISLARGEYEAIQVVVIAAEKTLQGVKVSVGDLIGPNGARIPADAVTIQPVGYVDNAKFADRWPFPLRKKGWIPDPLLPDRAFTVEKGTCQPVLVTVYAAPGQAAGEYKGLITIQTADAGLLPLPLVVRVYGFNVPRTGHLRTFAWKPQNGMQVNEELYFRNRMPSAMEANGFSWNKAKIDRKADGTFDFTKMDAKIERFLDRGATTFFIASVPTPGKWGFPAEFDEAWQSAFKELVAAYYGHMQSKGWEQYAFLYNIDEATKNNWPKCRQIFELSRAVAPGLKVVQCLNEVGGVEALDGYADAWNVYVSQNDRQAVDAHRTRGEEIWWALCVWPADKPQAYVDYPLIDQRIMGWMCWKYGINSFDHWALCDWKEDQPSDGAWAACADGVLTTAWQFKNNRDSVNHLCYPHDNNTPISSLRFEAFRDAWEDYEYLWLLREALPHLSGTDRGEAETILSISDTIIFTKAEYTDDPQQILRLRLRAAELIERAAGRK